MRERFSGHNSHPSPQCNRCTRRIRFFDWLCSAVLVSAKRWRMWYVKRTYDRKFRHWFTYFVILYYKKLLLLWMEKTTTRKKKKNCGDIIYFWHGFYRDLICPVVPNVIFVIEKPKKVDQKQQYYWSRNIFCVPCSKKQCAQVYICATWG